MTNTYVFDNTETDGDAMHHHLAAMYDPFTTRRLGHVGVARNARCLAIAVGASTIASVLADLAPDGLVVATDTNPHRCPPDPRVDLRNHDVVTDPLPSGPWDLIWVRLLLGHLDQRHEILRALAAALSPGGVLLVEEFEGSWRNSVLSSPSPDADRLFAAYHDAFATVLTTAGNDLTWSRRVHHAMLQLGLDTDTQGHTNTWAGGTPGALLPHTTAGAIRPKLIQAGMTATDIDAFRQLLLNPQLKILGNHALSTSGRRH